jgi:hypothetical protein
MYKELVDPALADKEWISEDELVEEGLATKKRSTNKLQSLNLEKFGIKMRPAMEALRDSMTKYAAARKLG